MKLNSENSSPYLALNDPELLFSMVFNQQFQCMVILSPEGRVIDVNEFFLTSQRTERAEIVGRFFWETDAWRNLPEWEFIWKQRLIDVATQHHPIATEDVFEGADGTIHSADAITTAIYDTNNSQLIGYVIQAIDTTKSRLVKSQTKESEARLKRILKHSHIGSWELDLIDHRSIRSLIHDQIFGYETLLPNWTYELFLEHVLIEDRAGVDYKFQEAIALKKDWNFECRIKRKDGEIRWIYGSGGQEFDTEGNVKSMVGIVQDITERKQSELDKLHHSAELQSLFNALPDIYFRMQHDGTIIDYHAQNQKQLYLKPEDFVGKRMQDILPSDIGALFQSKIDEIARLEEPLVFTYELQVDDELQHFNACLNKITLNEQIVCIIRDVTNEFKSKQSLTLSEQRFRTIFEQAAIGVALVDPINGQFIRVNKQLCDMLGYSIEELSNGKTFRDITHPDDIRVSVNHIERLLAEEHAVSLEKRYLHKKGHIVWAELSISSPPKVSGISQPVIVVVQDISQRKKAQDSLRLAANVFTYAAEGIMITDATGAIMDVNATFTSTTGYHREEVIDKNPRFLHSGRQSSEFYADMWRDLQKNGFWSGEVWNRHKNGEIYAEMLNISAVKDAQGVITNYVGLFTDITLMKAHQAQLEHTAHHDLLTNLPNRSLLADRLSQAMLQCRRRERSLAVVFLDLDGFKAVNDTYGHDVGDELLIALSTRIKNALREGDTLARIGGDEFVAVLADLSKIEDCEQVLERFLLAASDPITIGDIVLTISASIGVTLYPQDDVDADLLMRHADQAMYVAKELGKNRYHLFDTAQDDAVKMQRSSLEAIRYALDQQQFVLYYQPKVNMRTGCVVGVEALIRWQHPKLGILAPNVFLPIIENHSMSIEVGEWVIESALTQIGQWQALNLPLSISVNIAALQLQQSNFTDRLTALLAAHPDVDPCNLELEVLETSALEDVKHVSTTIIDCMALGVQFALDDFGTGYSSLTYLRRLPVNLIKIDQSFVRDMLHDTDDFAIVEGVIALAKSFKREVIAEGVETVEHGRALLQLGCELAQGYGIAKPMTADKIPDWVCTWKTGDNWQFG